MQDFIWRRASTIDVKHWIDSGEWCAGCSLSAGTWSLCWRGHQFSMDVFTFVQEAPRLSVLCRGSSSQEQMMKLTAPQFSDILLNNDGFKFEKSGHHLFMRVSDSVSDNAAADKLAGGMSSGSRGNSYVSVTRRIIQRDELLDPIRIFTSPFRSSKELWKTWSKGKPVSQGFQKYAVDKMSYDELKLDLKNRGEDVERLLTGLNKTKSTALMKQVLKHSHLCGTKSCLGQIVGNSENFNKPVLHGFAYGAEVMHPVGDQIDKVISLAQNILKPHHRTRAKRDATESFLKELDKTHYLGRNKSKITISEKRLMLARERELFAPLGAHAESKNLVEAAKVLGVIVSILYSHNYNRNKVRVSALLVLSGYYRWLMISYEDFIRNKSTKNLV